jgi:hypothetical protein
VKGLWLVGWLALAAVAGGGCADPCETLQRMCDGCQDPNQKASCEQIVVAQSHDDCTQGLDSFKNICK